MSVAEATGLMDQYAEEAMYVAGGTDLIPNMKHRLFEPTHLIALKSVSELSGIREENGYLRIGAAETLAEVARHQEVKKLFPALSDDLKDSKATESTNPDGLYQQTIRSLKES